MEPNMLILVTHLFAIFPLIVFLVLEASSRCPSLYTLQRFVFLRLVLDFLSHIPREQHRNDQRPPRPMVLFGRLFLPRPDLFHVLLRAARTGTTILHHHLPGRQHHSAHVHVFDVVQHHVDDHLDVHHRDRLQVADGLPLLCLFPVLVGLHPSLCWNGNLVLFWKPSSKTLAKGTCRGTLPGTPLFFQHGRVLVVLAVPFGRQTVPHSDQGNSRFDLRHVEFFRKPKKEKAWTPP